MINKNIYVFVVIFMLGIGLCECKWCIVSTIPTDDELQKFLDYGCSRYDCSPILPGGACFYPDIMQAHALWILDKVYRETGICQKYLGTLTDFDPSRQGICTYP